MDLPTLFRTCLINRTYPTYDQLRHFRPKRSGLPDLSTIYRTAYVSTDGMPLTGSFTLRIPRGGIIWDGPKDFDVNLNVDLDGWGLEEWKPKDLGDFDITKYISTCVRDRTEPTLDDLNRFQPTGSGTHDDLLATIRRVLAATDGMGLKGDCTIRIPRAKVTDGTPGGEGTPEFDLSDLGLDDYEQVGGDMDLPTLFRTCLTNRTYPTYDQLRYFRPRRSGLPDLSTIYRTAYVSTDGIPLTGSYRLRIPRGGITRPGRFDLDLSGWGLDDYDRVGGDMDLNTLLVYCIKNRREPTPEQLAWFRPRGSDSYDLLRLFRTVLACTSGIPLSGDYKIRIPRGSVTKSTIRRGGAPLVIDLGDWDLDDYEQLGDMDLNTLVTTCILNSRMPTEKELKWFRPSRKGCPDLKQFFKLILSASNGINFDRGGKISIPRIKDYGTVEKEPTIELDMSDWGLDDYKQVGGDMDLNTLLIYCIRHRCYPTEEQLAWFKPTGRGCIDLRFLIKLILAATDGVPLRGNVKLRPRLSDRELARLEEEYLDELCNEDLSLDDFVPEDGAKGDGKDLMSIILSIMNSPEPLSEEEMSRRLKIFVRRGSPYPDLDRKLLLRYVIRILDRNQWGLDDFEQVDGDMDLLTLISTCIIQRREPTLREIKCFRPTKKGMLDLGLIIRLILGSARGLNLESASKPNITDDDAKLLATDTYDDLRDGSLSLDDFIVSDDVEGPDAKADLRTIILTILNSPHEMSDDAIMSKIKIFVRRYGTNPDEDHKALLRLILRARRLRKLILCGSGCKDFPNCPDYLEVGSCDYTDDILLGYFTHKTNPGYSWLLRLLFLCARLTGYSLAMQRVIRRYALEFNYSDLIIKILDRAIKRYKTPAGRRFAKKSGNIADRVERGFNTLRYRAETATDRYNTGLKNYQADTYNYLSSLDRIRQARERLRDVISKQDDIDWSYRKYTTHQTTSPSYYRFYYKYPELKEEPAEVRRSRSRYYSYRSGHCCHLADIEGDKYTEYY